MARSLYKPPPPPSPGVTMSVGSPAMHESYTPSPGTPGEGGGEGLLQVGPDPHPNPLPEYRARGREGRDRPVVSFRAVPGTGEKPARPFLTPNSPAWLARRGPGACLLLACLLLAGCASSTQTPALAGPPQHEEAWVFRGSDSARKLITPHYILYTTIENDDIVQKLGQLMEGAYGTYQQVVPGLTLSERPLECYLFENRPQWAKFTESRAGDDARIYLQINRGGYTAGDTYVAYFIGDLGTYSVAAHEGFHQFLGRHFRSRPPPFLEEGLACMFEGVSWEGELPRWDLSSNPARLASLRRTAASGSLMPLGDLIGLHAGQVVDKSSGHIEAFYAQSWAFARFCREAQGGKYRPALERLLAECADGTAYPTTRPIDRASPRLDTGNWHWERSSVKPLLERYLGEDFAAIERDYRTFVTGLLASRAPDESPPP